MRRQGIVIGMLVALVVAAFTLRAVRSGGSNVDGDRPTQVLCATDMADACAALASPDLEVRIEPPATTVARLAAGDTLQADAWLTPRPWLDLARARAAATPTGDSLGEASAVIARSPVVLIIRSDRRGPLETACNGVIDWFCLARRAGEPWATIGGDTSWGAVSVAIDDPTRHTSGLLALAQMAATFSRRTPFDWRDLEATRSTLRSVIDRLPDPAERPALDVMLDQGGSYDGAFSLEAGTRIAIASPRASGQLEFVAPAPTVRADAVLVPPAGATRTVDLDAVRDALTANGWHFPDRADAGVPDAASTEALLTIWTSIRTSR